jgi:ElaB/YqjD/DUF883 family membrane-anchored ribosome-binding protein
MSNTARTATDRLPDTRATTADGLETAASPLHKGAESLPSDAVSGLAHSAADRLSTTADYVRRNDVNRMVADVETLVKNNPGLSLGIAAAFGFHGTVPCPSCCGLEAGVWRARPRTLRRRSTSCSARRDSKRWSIAWRRSKGRSASTTSGSSRRRFDAA